MGSAIAAHFTNAGCAVNLLDIADKNNKNKNHIVEQAIIKLLKIKPSPFTLKSNVQFIKPGNLEDNLNLINNSDWVIEAIIEDLNIKKKLYQKIDNIMKDDLIVSSNTSTIPIKLLTEGLSIKFKKNFLITHFFNPPRYLKLLEVVKSHEVNKEKLALAKSIASNFLPKTPTAYPAHPPQEIDSKNKSEFPLETAHFIHRMVMDNPDNDSFDGYSVFIPHVIVNPCPAFSLVRTF